MKKNDRKTKNEIMKISKHLKEEIYFRKKLNEFSTKTNNEFSFPEVLKITPQKKIKNEDFFPSDAINIIKQTMNLNKTKEQVNSAHLPPHKRASSNSNNSLLEADKNNNDNKKMVISIII